MTRMSFTDSAIVAKDFNSCEINSNTLPQVDMKWGFKFLDESIMKKSLV